MTSETTRDAARNRYPQPDQDLKKRHFQRFPVEHIEGTLHTPGDLRVVDLSQTGLAFETEFPVEEGSRPEIELRYRNQGVRVAVRVRWARPERREKERQIYRSGAEFLDVIEKSDTGLWDFILAEGNGGG
jgi:hypothetical protein